MKTMDSIDITLWINNLKQGESIPQYIKEQADRLTYLGGGVVLWNQPNDEGGELVIVSGSIKEAGRMPGFADVNAAGRADDNLKFLCKCWHDRKDDQSFNLYDPSSYLGRHDRLVHVTGTFGDIKSWFINNDKV
jgi:hypothetical protein